MSTSPLQGPAFTKAAEALSKTVRFLAARGWTPATSSNFSTRLPDQRVAISRSGVDKFAFAPKDVMIVDLEGKAVAPKDARPSAETLLHTLLYKRFEDVGAVLHTHSVNGTVLSMHAGGGVPLSDFELLKGLRGVDTHQTSIVVPVFPNSQNMEELAAEVSAWMDMHPDDVHHGFLIQGHGLYAWGRDLDEARRHVETFEFLFECVMKMR